MQAVTAIKVRCLGSGISADPLRRRRVGDHYSTGGTARAGLPGIRAGYILRSPHFSARDIMADGDGSLVLASFWMLILSLLLIWLPGVGPLIAGIVGGKLAGSAWRGVLAALLPGVLLALVLFFGGALLTGVPVVGAFFAGGTLLIYLVCIPTMLLGALIGGLLA
jgi:hypothetical protein